MPHVQEQQEGNGENEKAAKVLDATVGPRPLSALVYELAIADHRVVQRVVWLGEPRIQVGSPCLRVRV